MNKDNDDSTQKLDQIIQHPNDQQINDRITNHVKNDRTNIQENGNQKNDEINDQLINNDENIQKSDNQTNKEVRSNIMNNQDSQKNNQTIDYEINDKNSNIGSDKMESTVINHKLNENFDVSIVTPVETMSSSNTKNDSKIRQENSDNQTIEESIRKKIANISIDESQSQENHNEKSKQEVENKIPELLLTENNRPNKGNELLIGLMLLFKFITYLIIKFIGLFHPTRRNVLSPINEPLLLLSANEITERIKSGQLKCEHVISAYINRIESVQPKLNAMIDNCFEDALKRAREIDEQLKDPILAKELKKLPLLGVPFTCKNSISIKGLALNAGVKIRKDAKATQDATVIANLRSAGAIPLGLTNTPELILWYDSDNKLYGRTNNPYDTSRIVGGSSGGEGCIIAAAGSLIGVASDVAGSIRIPAMFNGVFGHKTTLKYITVDGMFPTPPEKYKTFFSYGPICRYARDLPIALKAMGGNLTDELRLDEPVDFKNIKIYYMENDGNNLLTSFVDKRIINSMHKVIKYFESEYGTKTEQININKFKYSLAFFGTICVKNEVKIEDYITSTGHLNVYWEFFKSFFGKSDITRPILIQILNQNSPVCNPDSAIYKRFAKMLKELKPKVHDMLGNNAVLMMPTWPIIAPKHQTTILRGFDATYTCIMNAFEIPATHCPVGLTKEEGMPIGFTIAAGPGHDRIPIAFAKEIERVFNGWIPPSSK